MNRRTDTGAGYQPAPFHQLPRDPLPAATAFFGRAEDGVRLRMALWRPAGPARGTVLLFPGRTEYLEKYAPVAGRLTDRGLAVLAIDWRGQGMSDRLLADPRPGHVTDFAAYQGDVVEMVVAAQSLDLPRPWNLLAHSMGGCIGLAALIGGLPVRSAAFSAPMWGLDHPLLPAVVISGMAGTAHRLGRADRAAVGTGGGGTYLLDAAFTGNALTSNHLQWARLVAEAGSWPHLTLGGATYAWVGAAMAEIRRLAMLASPELPALIGVGALEKVVSRRAIHARAGRWPQANLLDLPDARHELMFETPETADRFLDSALALFLG